jgi:hypothetical protein
MDVKELAAPTGRKTLDVFVAFDPSEDDTVHLVFDGRQYMVSAESARALGSALLRCASELIKRKTAPSPPQTTAVM